MKAEKSLKKLVEDYPWVAQYKSDLARSWSLGVFYAERKTLGEPEPYLKQAAQIWEGLVRAPSFPPGVPCSPRRVLHLLRKPIRQGEKKD